MCDVEECSNYPSREGKWEWSICDDCFKRLCLMGVNTDLKKFFSTPKPEDEVAPEVEAYFNALFPNK